LAKLKLASLSIFARILVSFTFSQLFNMIMILVFYGITALFSLSFEKKICMSDYDDASLM
jgi:hypothetical protein